MCRARCQRDGVVVDRSKGRWFRRWTLHSNDTRYLINRTFRIFIMSATDNEYPRATSQYKSTNISQLDVIVIITFISRLLIFPNGNLVIYKSTMILIIICILNTFHIITCSKCNCESLFVCIKLHLIGYEVC